MKVITLVNEKGGVGKTTLSAHLAAGLAGKGHRVVFVDTDPQANGTVAFGQNPEPRFYDLTVRLAPWRDVLRIVPQEVYAAKPSKGMLAVVPSNIESRNVESTMKERAIIRQRFAEMQNAVDFIIVDTSPTPSLLHEALLAATDYVVIPTDCEEFSAYHGVPNTILHAGKLHDEALARGVDLARVIGVIPNKYRANTSAHNVTLQNLREEYGDLIWNPINMSIQFAEAQLLGKFVYNLDSESRPAFEMRGIVERVEQAAEVLA